MKLSFNKKNAYNHACLIITRFIIVKINLNSIINVERIIGLTVKTK